jgi:hypothetical protein
VVASARWWPVEIDRLWDTDAPSTDVDGVAPDEVDASGGGVDAPDGDHRAADCAEYRAMADAMYRVVARERWEAAKPTFRAEWAEHQRQHPAPPDASPTIDQSTRRQVEAGCKGIRETEETIVTPAMRRIIGDGERDDQAFTRKLQWEHTGTLYSYERGNLDNQIYEITEDEANQIVERIRQTVAERANRDS